MERVTTSVGEGREQLNDCPFCGGVAHILGLGNFTSEIRCGRYPASMTGDDRPALVQAWN